MGYEAFTTEETASGKPLTQAKARKIKDNFDYLYGLSGVTESIGIPNGSFEIDADADGTPDSWTKNLYAGGTGALYSVSPASGERAWSFTHPGGASNGGGYLDSDYVEVSNLFAYYLSWAVWATAAGMRNKVIIRYFSAAKADLSADETLYNSIQNSVTPFACVASFTPPANARFAKVRLVGGYTDTDVAGTAYFDAIQMTLALSIPAIIGMAVTPRTTTSLSYVKLKEIQTRTNKVMVAFFLSSSDPVYTAYSRIYVNDVAVGVENSTTTSLMVTQFLNVLPTDLIQVYAKCSVGIYTGTTTIWSLATTATPPITLWDITVTD